MRRIKIGISEEFLMNFLTEGDIFDDKVSWVRCTKGLPEDAKLISAQVATTPIFTSVINSLEIVFEHPSFDDVDEPKEFLPQYDIIDRK